MLIVAVIYIWPYALIALIIYFIIASKPEKFWDAVGRKPKKQKISKNNRNNKPTQNKPYYNNQNMNQNNMVQPDTNSNMFFKQPEPKQSVPTQNNSNMAMETLEQDELVTAAQEMQMPAGGTIQDLNQSSNGVIAPSDFVEPTS